MSATPGPATAAKAPSLFGRFIKVAKQDPLGALAVIGLAISLVLFIAEFRYLTSLGNESSVLVRNLGYGVWTISLMMLVTVATRTLRVRHVLRHWLFGFFPALAGVLVVESAITLEAGNLRSAFIVPILEESLKAIPLLVLLLMARARRVADPSITDFAIAGFAIGAGFGLHEDGLWERDIAGGFDSSLWGRLFPNFLDDNPFVVAHPGWTALVGLGIGFMWHFRHRNAAWVLGLAPFSVAVFDHISINYRGDAQDRLRGLMMDGKLPAWLLVAGLVLAVVIDWHSRRSAPMEDLSTLSLKNRLQAAWSLPTPKMKLFGGVLLIAQLRWLNGIAYHRARSQPASSRHGLSSAEKAPAADEAVGPQEASLIF